MEKFYAWSDKGPDGRLPFTRDDLLTNVMIYWVTQTIGSSPRFYYEKAHKPAAPEPSYVRVPTGFASFAHDIYPAPRAFAARFFNLQRWTEMPRGGHFAALEVPGALATELRAFFRPFRTAEDARDPIVVALPPPSAEAREQILPQSWLRGAVALDRRRFQHSPPFRSGLTGRDTPATSAEPAESDPRSPRPRGTDESTNGLVRQYLPERSDYRRRD